MYSLKQSNYVLLRKVPLVCLDVELFPVLPHQFFIDELQDVYLMRLVGINTKLCPLLLVDHGLMLTE
ncbi:hypothetical protein A214_12330 [Pseudomonas aeruginosa SJTD-1]|nr:hypothetical protein A214_12330 [Pseudomonas aeruginosa SJTD-1]